MMNAQVNMSEIELKDQKINQDRLTFGLKFWSKYDKHET